MGETVVVTVELPNIVDKELDKYSKEYMSKGEFIRSAIIKFWRENEKDLFDNVCPAVCRFTRLCESLKNKWNGIGKLDVG